MEKEPYKKNKISRFPAQEEQEECEEWLESFKRQLQKDTEELEKELEENQELRGMDAPPELFRRIVGQLKAEGKWEEEDGQEENGQEETSADILSLLSGKDREALEIGREIQRKGKRAHINGWRKMAAAVAVCVLMVSISSGASRQYAAGVVNRVTGDKWGVYMEASDEDTLKDPEDERKAYRELEEQLGIPVPQIQYRPEGMEFEGHHIERDKRGGFVFYKYGEAVVTMYLYKHKNGATMQCMINSGVTEEVGLDGMEIPAKLYTLDKEGAYAGDFVYDNCYCVIVGEMEKKEFQKVLENIIFSS